MGRFKSKFTQVVVSVDDSKDDRFGEGWDQVKESKSSAKSTSGKSSK